MDKIDDALRDYYKERKERVAPPEFVTRAKGLVPQRVTGSGECPHCGKPITPFKKPLAQQRILNGIWLVLAAVSFLLSFAFPGYFVQCVAASLLFGVKWAVDSKNTRTQILIYKALREEGEAGGSSRIKDLHRHSTHL
jgi:hypothetical protein